MAQDERCGGGLLDALIPGLGDWLRDFSDARLLARLQAMRTAPGVLRPPISLVVPLLREGDLWKDALVALISFLTITRRAGTDLLRGYVAENNNRENTGVVIEKDCSCNYQVRRTIRYEDLLLLLMWDEKKPTENDPVGILQLIAFWSDVVWVQADLVFERREHCPKLPPDQRQRKDRLDIDSGRAVIWEARYKQTNGKTIIEQETKLSANDMKKSAEELMARAEAFFSQAEQSFETAIREACRKGS